MGLTNRKWLQRSYRVGLFLLLYGVATLAVVPLLARPFGRVPLPLTSSQHLQPLTRLTWLLNRHYVRPELREAVFDIARAMNQAYPGTQLHYLDSNFPFLMAFRYFPTSVTTMAKSSTWLSCTGMPLPVSPSMEVRR